MKKFAALTIAALTTLAASNASAVFGNNSFFGNDKYNEPECWYNPYDCNPYEPFDPRFYFEEMKNMFDNNNNYGGYGYPYGQMPYGQMPYGAAPQGQPAMPYAPRMPMPYYPQAPMAPQAPAQK